MTATPESAVPRATNIRWLILAVSTLSAVLLYLDRICASFVAESIRVEFQASQSDMSWFLSAFFWSYALAQVPAGRLSDRFGIRTMLTWYILAWSACTALMGLSTGIVSLLGYRFGLGLGQAGAYPSCARAVRDWMPLEQRGMASSLVAFGGRAGGAIAPVLTGLVMLWVALSQGPPEFQPREIRSPEELTKSFPPESESAERWRFTLGRAVQTELSRGPTDDPATAWSRGLNLVDPYAVLRAEADAMTTLPPELQLRLNAQDTTSQATALARRQFWETACPAGVRKLEARGWRRTLILYGVSGIVVAGIFWWLFRNTPAEHPWSNDAERRLIAGASPITTTADTERFPWGVILTDLSLWGNSLCQFMTNVGWVFLVTLLPRYLDDVHKVPVVERSIMSSIPIFAGMFGMLLGGPWTDRLTTRYGLRWGRRLPIVWSRLIAIVGYGVCLSATTGLAGPLGTRAPAWVAVAGLAVVAIATDLGVAATWAWAQDVAGRHTAAVVGWANMWGNLGAAMAPPLSTLVLGETPGLSEWNSVFWVCAGAFIVAGLGGWTMDASRPLVRPA
jgi:MFS family permease